MSEMKCPCCGGPIQKYDDPYASSFLACNSENDECMFVCDIKNFSRISAAMELARATVEWNNQTGGDKAFAMFKGAQHRVIEVFNA